MVNVVTIVGEFVTHSGKVEISFGKVVSDTVKAINQLDTFATTAG